ncbi:hypothetical protein AVEN_66911-1 [Araneus ventricosus]|uniref:Uncharacterized protein n=1 Tax=Araneus ventricosus TaxID=182803 RepID=A0A4Y2SW55_ARAVE|nr:hypothetical protein AVEN_66911-1 [Araneus ventricosus]
MESSPDHSFPNKSWKTGKPMPTDCSLAPETGHDLRPNQMIICGKFQPLLYAIALKHHSAEVVADHGSYSKGRSVDQKF